MLLSETEFKNLVMRSLPGCVGLKYTSNLPRQKLNGPWGKSLTGNWMAMVMNSGTRIEAASIRLKTLVLP